MMRPSRLGCPLSLKTPNMGNPGCAVWRLVSDEAATGVDVALRAWLENRCRTLVLGEVKHPRHQWHMEGEDDTNKRIAAFNSYCRIASWDKPWQISRAMEVAAPSSSKMLRACSTISTDGWSPAISSCSA